MGTNIYARINHPKAEREKFVLKVKAIVDSDELFMFNKLDDLLQECKEEYPEVHLGKCSYGWQFLWAGCNIDIASSDSSSVEYRMNNYRNVVIVDKHYDWDLLSDD